ncbi:hypothetical protein U9M48_044205 [Paspalum notatum var. saurae]|uniref:NADP-dependent oxidoreductase domain-containing protein n=1 Tax=Paspalum notatum var. saurae TaxID=547442 RepID=A0AAQ3UYS8_PASNO
MLSLFSLCPSPSSVWSLWRRGMAKSFILNTGAAIPSIGLGTWQISPGVVEDAIRAALQAGYRHIDCSPRYGNQKELKSANVEETIRWGIQMVHSVLPKSANEARIKENISILGWSIPEDLMAKLSEIKQAMGEASRPHQATTICARISGTNEPKPQPLLPCPAHTFVDSHFRSKLFISSTLLSFFLPILCLEMARSFLLNTGARIPSLGLGTWQIEHGAVTDAIYAAVKAGYRHIDSAVAYRNQKEVGLALKKLFEDGVVKRDDLFITSKLWPGNHAPEDVMEDIATSLKDLQLDYLDLYLVNSYA